MNDGDARYEPWRPEGQRIFPGTRTARSGSTDRYREAIVDVLSIFFGNSFVDSELGADAVDHVLFELVADEDHEAVMAEVRSRAETR